MTTILINIDRDGTLIYDGKDHLYLGMDDNWKSKVRILPYVIEGIKRLNTLTDSAVYMITNQPGIAISDFPLLTLERAHEVCKYVIDKIKGMGGYINGYFLCPHANRTYVEQHRRYHFHKELVCDCDCIKPGTGMVFDALKSEGVAPEDVDIYVIGDRATDVKAAQNINGTGILIPFENEPEEEDKVKKLKSRSNIYIAQNLLDAAELIGHRHSSGSINI